MSKRKHGDTALTDGVSGGATSKKQYNDSLRAGAYVKTDTDLRLRVRIFDDERQLRTRRVVTAATTRIAKGTVIGHVGSFAGVGEAEYVASPMYGYGIRVAMAGAAALILVPNGGSPSKIEEVCAIMNWTQTAASANAAYEPDDSKRLRLVAIADIAGDREILIRSDGPYSCALSTKRETEEKARQRKTKERLEARRCLLPSNYHVCTRVVDGVACEGGYLLKNQARHNAEDCPTCLPGLKIDYSPEGEAAAQNGASVVANSAPGTEYEPADEAAETVAPSVDTLLKQIWRDREEDDLILADKKAGKCIDRSDGYGEPRLSFAHRILRMMKEVKSTAASGVAASESFIDLGSGRGKVVLAASVVFGPTVRCVGVEILTLRNQTAVDKRSRLLKSYANEFKNVQFDEADLCAYDVSAFTHVFVFGAVFTDEMLKIIRDKLSKSKWRVLALCLRRCRQAPIICGCEPVETVRIKLHKQNTSSFTFYIYAR